MTSSSTRTLVPSYNQPYDADDFDYERLTSKRFTWNQRDPNSYEPHTVPERVHTTYTRPATPPFPEPRVADFESGHRLSGNTSYSSFHGRVPPATATFGVPAINRPGVRTSNLSLHSVDPSSHDAQCTMTTQSYEDLEKDPTPSRASQQSIKMSRPREILFIAVVAVSHLMTQAALGQALAPIDIISQSFGPITPGQMSWFIAAYSLTVGTFILISGRLGDTLGHKRVFAFGYAWFGIWSGFTGFSIYPGRQIFFDICRAMQGIGPALLLPNALALFGRAYPAGMKKNIVFSIFGALAPLGFVVGATFGSLFSQLLWWPWTFWSFGLACLFLCLCTLLIVPKELSVVPTNPPSFDVWGSLFGVAGLILVNVAFNNGPLYGWSTTHVLFTLALGLTCLFAFLGFEVQATAPLLPIKALNGTVAFTLSLVGVGWGAFGIWVFYLCRFLSLIRHQSPLSISASFSPAIVSGLLAAGLTGFLLTHFPVSFVMLVAMLAFLLGISLTAFMPVQQIYWAQTFFSIVIMPFGMDCSFPAATLILSNHMPAEHQGLAASLVNTVVNYTISLALGIAGSVEVATLGYGGPFGSEEGVGRGMVGEGMHAVSEEIWVHSWRWAMITACALSGAGVVLGFIFFARTTLKHGWRVMDH